MTTKTDRLDTMINHTVLNRKIKGRSRDEVMDAIRRGRERGLDLTWIYEYGSGSHWLLTQAEFARINAAR